MPQDPATSPVAPAIDVEPAARVPFHSLSIEPVCACITIGAGFLWVLNEEGVSVETARTVAFCTACYAQMIFVFGCRSNRLVLFQLGLRSNLALLAAVCASSLLQLGTVLLLVGRRLFGTTPLTLEHWLLIVVLALVPISVLEITKLLVQSRSPNTTAKDL